MQGRGIDIRKLLPDDKSIVLDSIQMDETSRRVNVRVRSVSRGCRCPKCGGLSNRVHSRYERQLNDLPWQGFQVCITWITRKLFCDNSDCERRIFSEQRLLIATPHSRRTERLHQVTRSLAVACGGELGHRLASRLGIAVSPDTLLRDIRKLDYPPSEEPRVVGVDDWAYRRGERYGTLICNLENGHVVDLLPDRSVESWANWLKQHPTVMTVSRDRGDIYRKGTLLGAPEALQVADRFHLVKNLYESFCVYVKRQLQTLRSAVPKAEECAQYGKSAKTPIRPTQKELRKLENRQRRLALYNQIRQLHTLGHSAYSIARQCGIHRHTVCRYLLSSDFPERTVRSYSSTADSIKDYLRDRWNAGCRNVMVL